MILFNVRARMKHFVYSMLVNMLQGDEVEQASEYKDQNQDLGGKTSITR